MNILIIEDEPLAARNLESYLDKIGDFETEAIIDSVHDAVAWFRSNDHPDLVFMDIHLADGSSFEIFKQTTIHCPVIFTTAYDEYALQAFKVNSIDYLLKPFEVKDVEQALQKYKNLKQPSLESEKIQQLIELIRPAKSHKSHFLVLQGGDKLVPLAASNIACFHINNGVVSVITKEGKRLPMDHTLEELEQMLDPENFFRANRQYIVAHDSIKEASLWFNSRLTLTLKVKTPERIIISKARVPEFKNWFMN